MQAHSWHREAENLDFVLTLRLYPVTSISRRAHEQRHRLPRRISRWWLAGHAVRLPRREGTSPRLDPYRCRLLANAAGLLRPQRQVARPSDIAGRIRLGLWRW